MDGSPVALLPGTRVFVDRVAVVASPVSAVRLAVPTLARSGRPLERSVRDEVFRCDLSRAFPMLGRPTILLSHEIGSAEVTLAFGEPAG